MRCVVRVRGVIAGLLLGALTGGAASDAAAQQSTGSPMRVAFVNARNVLQGMPGYAQAESTFTKEVETGRTEASRLQARIDSMVAEFQQQEPMLNASTRAARRKDLEQKGQQAQQQMAAIQTRLGQRERDLLSPMQQRLSAVIEGIRAEGNFAMIIDLSAEGLGIITYDKSLDITERVVQRLRQSN